MFPKVFFNRQYMTVRNITISSNSTNWLYISNYCLELGQLCYTPNTGSFVFGGVKDMLMTGIICNEGYIDTRLIGLFKINNY